MLKLARKVEYGLISIVHIGSKPDGELATAREISEFYNISTDTLGKVLQDLRRHQLVESIQGVNGGYRLKRSLTEMTLGDVIEAIEGPIHVAPCTCVNYVCHQEHSCNIKGPIFHFQDRLMQFLYSLSLAEFLEKPELTPAITKTIAHVPMIND